MAHGTGVVLSCGDFLCNKCSNLMDKDSCPICCTSGIRTAPLSNPPEEVQSKMGDTSANFQNIFGVLEFQLTHYKDTLARASQRLIALKIADEEQKRYSCIILSFVSSLPISCVVVASLNLRKL